MREYAIPMVDPVNTTAKYLRMSVENFRKTMWRTHPRKPEPAPPVRAGFVCAAPNTPRPNRRGWARDTVFITILARRAGMETLLRAASTLVPTRTLKRAPRSLRRATVLRESYRVEDAIESRTHGFSKSRCVSRTRYPACARRLRISLAIITDRWCPPVQPNEIVR